LKQSQCRFSRRFNFCCRGGLATSLQFSILHPSCRRVCGGGRV